MHHFKKDEILVKVSAEACLQPFLPHSRPAGKPFMAQYCALDTFSYQEVSDGKHSTLTMTVVLTKREPLDWMPLRI